MSASPAWTCATASLGVAEVADVVQVRDGLVREAEEVLEHDAVDLDDVELRLALGDPGVEGLQEDLDGLFFGGQEMGRRPW